ncbi:MAG: ArsR family transcriptional regulator [Thermoplasmata archaeon]
MAEKKLTKKQKDLVDRLRKAGVERNIALTLVFVAGKDEATRRDIENATGLKQPEVSIATQAMRSKEWMDKRDIKKEGKGRPVHGYKLDKPINDIIKEIEEEEKARIEEMENNLNKIKDLVQSIY